jgi:hypothetical protein
MGDFFNVEAADCREDRRSSPNAITKVVSKIKLQAAKNSHPASNR